MALFLASVSRAAVAPALADTFHTDGRGSVKLMFPKDRAGAAADGRQAADAFIKANQARFKVSPEQVELAFVSARESLLGTHYRYRQLVNGVPVEGAEFVVSVGRADGRVYQAYNNTYPLAAKPALPNVLIGKDAALDAAWGHLRVHGRLLSPQRAQLAYVPARGGFRLVYKTNLSVEAPLGHWEHQIDAASGAVVSVRDSAIYRKGRPRALPDFARYAGTVWPRAKTAETYAAATDARAKAVAVAAKTTVSGSALVFDGDPRTYLANAALVNGSSASSFTVAYVTRPLRDISLTSGTYSLSGPWVVITDLESPNTAPSTTTDGQWTAVRGNNAFNDAMTYFHLDQNQRYVQSLGYVGAAGIQNGPIEADSDGVSGDDNSYYSPSGNYLSFGHGGVDDNEDADVILHEYGHALTFSIIPSWGGGDTGAIGEGFGDYWGASYSSTTTNGTTFHPEWAFSWDGHSADTWSGRFLNLTNLTYDATHMYVDHETIGGIANYSDQLWGTPLFQAFLTLRGMGCPREDIDKIVLESFFGIGSGPTMRDMANATVKAAMELFPSGPHASVFYDKFAKQLILTAQPLLAPALINPAGGEGFGTGTVVQVRWDRRGAPSRAAAQIEYTAKLSGGPIYFSDQVEGGENGWAKTKTTGGSAWAVVTTASHSSSHSWYAKNDTVSSSQYLTRSSIVVSNGTVLAFWHLYDLESGYDGAVVELSTNGTTWIDIGTNAVQNGYNSVISATDGSGIAGRRAFSGSSDGFVETKIPLTAFQGKTVSIRFVETDDGYYGSSGWWVDDIRLYVDAPWSAVATTATNVSSYAWTLPATPGTNYGVRVKQAGSNLADSAWATSAAFTLKGIPTVMAWPSASAITYGQTLASSSLSGGAVSVSGAFSFVTPSAVPRAGVTNAAVAFAPTDAASYIAVTGSVAVTVNKAGSVVTAWPTASAIVVGQALVESTLSGGTASPAGSFEFASPALVPPAGAGLQSVRYVPDDAADYQASTGLVSVTVAPQPLISGFSASPGAAGSAFQFDAVGGIQYRVRYSESLMVPPAEWLWLTPPADGWVTALTNGPLTVVDPGATNSAARFYRLEERAP